MNLCVGPPTVLVESEVKTNIILHAESVQFQNGKTPYFYWKSPAVRQEISRNDVKFAWVRPACILHFSDYLTSE